MFFGLSNNSTRGYGQLLGPGALRPRPLHVIVLETMPPLFHITLLTLLAYYSIILNPDNTSQHLTVIFIVIQILLNWIFFVRNKSIVIASPKNFPGYTHRYPSLDKGSRNDFDPNAHRYQSEWKECESCDMHVPLRTHHCGHCRRCIYILDHHCYFLGYCVGRTNMRYFLVFCFYAAIGCATGISNLIHLMRFYRDPWSMEAPYYILPCTFVLFIIGKASAFEVLYVALINFGLGACLACIFLLCMGAFSVYTGRTPHEEKKKRQVRLVMREGEICEEDKTFADRFRDVFGEFGLLHFIIPYVPYEMPKAEVGYRRLITYNNDYIYNGDEIMRPEVKKIRHHDSRKREAMAKAKAAKKNQEKENQLKKKEEILKKKEQEILKNKDEENLPKNKKDKNNSKKSSKKLNEKPTKKQNEKQKEEKIVEKKETERKEDPKPVDENSKEIKSDNEENDFDPKYKKREIVENWAKYEIESESDSECEYFQEELKKGESYLRFNEEKVWVDDDKPLDDNPSFLIDMEALNQEISAINIHKELGITSNEISEKIQNLFQKDADENKKFEYANIKSEIKQKLRIVLENYKFDDSTNEGQQNPDVDALMLKYELISKHEYDEKIKLSKLNQSVNTENSNDKTICETPQDKQSTQFKDKETLELEDWLDDFLED